MDDFDEMWAESVRLGLEATSDPKTTDPVVRLGFSVTRKQVRTRHPISCPLSVGCALSLSAAVRRLHCPRLLVDVSRTG